MCLANELHGKHVKDYVLELNASDDRGIDVVRQKIKSFAQMKTSSEIPKIIILDEADSMTPAAQQALRRTMEIYSGSTRFALACNISSKIIEPIQSRCALIRFSKPSNEEILSRLLAICKQENVQYSPEGLDAILFTADGDVRQAINNLQSTFSGFDYISAENVYRVCDTPHPAVVRDILEKCVKGDINQSIALLKQLLSEGYSSIDIITTFFRVSKVFECDEYLRMMFMRKIGECHVKIVQGGSTIQLYGLMASMCDSL